MKNSCRKQAKTQLEFDHDFEAKIMHQIVENRAKMGAKSEKNRSKIEVKFEVDFGCDFGAKMEPKWSPKGAKMGAKSKKNRSKIDVKFEVDFGSDFGRHPGVSYARLGGMRGAGLTQIREFRGRGPARPAPGKPGAADSNAPRIPPSREGRCEQRTQI